MKTLISKKYNIFPFMNKKSDGDIKNHILIWQKRLIVTNGFVIIMIKDFVTDVNTAVIDADYYKDQLKIARDLKQDDVTLEEEKANVNHQLIQYLTELKEVINRTVIKEEGITNFSYFNSKAMIDIIKAITKDPGETIQFRMSIKEKSAPLNNVMSDTTLMNIISPTNKSIAIIMPMRGVK